MLELNVTGMTCGGCARSVSRAVESAVPGAKIDVDLPSGRVRVAGAADAARVKAAIEGAGFGVAEIR